MVLFRPIPPTYKKGKKIPVSQVSTHDAGLRFFSQAQKTASIDFFSDLTWASADDDV